MTDRVVTFPNSRPDSWSEEDLTLISKDLTGSVGLPVSLAGGQRETLVTIRCSSLDDLDRLCRILQASRPE